MVALQAKILPWINLESLYRTPTQDGVTSPEDIDTAMSQGLGLRYSFMGPFETMHLNATGIGDYCQRYGDNIVTVCETQARPHPLNGPTLSTVQASMEEQIPLDKLEERRKWRNDRLAALAVHKQTVDQKYINSSDWPDYDRGNAEWYYYNVMCTKVDTWLG